MFKLAGRVLDFYDDPDFVNNLTAQGLFGNKLHAPENVYGLPDRAFTIKIATRHGSVRKWPVFNKLAARLSGLYFNDVAEDLPRNIRDTAGFFLKKAHTAFGLPTPEALRPMFPQPNGWEVQLEEEEDHHVMASPDLSILVKQAQEDFLGDLGRMTPEKKFEQANVIFELCKRAQVDLDSRIWDFVEKERRGPYLGEELETRKTMIKAASGSVMAEAFLATLASFTDQGLKKIAEIITDFDRQSGLDKEWGRRLRDPYEAVYGGLGMKKQASKNEDILRWKLETLCMKPKELERIFEPLFVNKFINDPIGSYKNASPLTKKIILSLVKKLPMPSTGEVKAHLTESIDRGKDKIRLDWTLESVGKDIAEGRNGCL